MIYGYCRISRRTQNIERQIRNIQEAYPSALLIQEAYTGTKVEGRKEFEKLLKKVKPGDTIVFDSVSRMSRNAEEGFNQYKKWYDNHIELVFLKEPSINTAVTRRTLENRINITVDTGKASTDKFFSTIVEAMNQLQMDNVYERIKEAFDQSQKEVDDLHKRTSEGIETARKAGKQIGQKPGTKFHIKKKKPIMDEIRRKSRDFDGSYTDADLIKILDVSRNTYYKYKKELSQELSACDSKIKNF